jgi:radical SAM protein with 4Fe4S-binding SPASM domain
LRRLHDLFDPLGVVLETRNMHDYSGNDLLSIKGNPPERVFGGCVMVEQDSLYLTVDGRVQPCCAVFNQSFNIGRFPDEDFGSLLNNKKMSQIRHALRLDQRRSTPFCKNCTLSIGGSMTSEQVENYWTNRDREGLLRDTEERNYIFSKVLTPHVTIRKLVERCDYLQRELKDATEALERLERARVKATNIARQLDAMRCRRMNRLLDRFFDRSDMVSYVRSAFSQLGDEGVVLCKEPKGYRLRTSANLAQVQCIQYPLDLVHPGLTGILLAPSADIGLSKGRFGIEILSSSSEVIAQVSVPANQIDDLRPTRFFFQPIAYQGRLWLRVFARDVDGPIRVCEWQRYALNGLGPLQTKAFCGFLFEKSTANVESHAWSSLDDFSVS